jgi:hypothetical protein
MGIADITGNVSLDRHVGALNYFAQVIQKPILTFQFNFPIPPHAAILILNASMRQGFARAAFAPFPYSPLLQGQIHEWIMAKVQVQQEDPHFSHQLRMVIF